MLEIEGLRAGYGGVPVLNGVTIRVEAGEFVAIVGPNGAGKTTLFKTISGIVPPMAGSVRFEGNDLLAVAACRAPASRHRARARRPAGVSVADGARESGDGRLHRGRPRWPGAQNLEKIYTWFPVLAERAKAQAGALSGGQQQMLAIARGLASSPKLLMLDEPSMGLAPTVADEIFERIVAIHGESGLTVLLVEQRVAEALHYADRGYVLEAGRVVLEGSHDELRSNDRIRQAYLGM